MVGNDRSRLLALPTGPLQSVLSLVGCLNTVRLTCKTLLKEANQTTTKASRLLVPEYDVEECVFKVVKTLWVMPELTTLKVTSNGKTSDLADEMLQCPRTIQKLHITHQQSPDVSFVFPLERVLSRLPKLSHLSFVGSLRKCPTEALSHVPHLQHLDLDCDFPFEDVDGVVKALGALPELECLQIGYAANDTDASAVVKLLEAIGRKFIPLRDMRIEGKSVRLNVSTLRRLDIRARPGSPY